MAVEVAYDIRRQIAVMWDNTTGLAFGPVFDGPGCDQDAENFLDWLTRNPATDKADLHRGLVVGTPGVDARDYTTGGLDRAIRRWRQAADKYGSVEA
jgi:hypothetical protein